MTTESKKIKLPKFYFSFVVICLRLTGLEVLEEKRSFLYRAYTIFAVTLASSIVVLECIEFHYLNDFNELSFILWYFFADILALIKVALVYKNRREIGNLMRSFHEYPYKPDESRGGEYEFECVSNTLKQNHFHTAVYGISIQTSLITALISGLKLRLTQPPENWKLPFFSIKLFDPTHSPSFEIGYVYQGVVAYIIVVWTYLCDCAVISIIAQITAQLKILERCIRNYNGRGMGKETAERRSFSKKLSDIIEYHLAILKTIDKVESLCSYIVLCLFVAGLVLICLVLYNASMAPIQSIEFLRHLSYSTMTVIPIYMYCWWGNEMTLANEALALGIFETYHPDDPTSSAKTLKMMLVKAQKPLFLTAGKFAPLSLDTFKGIIKGSFSYFTVLRQVNTEQ